MALREIIARFGFQVDQGGLKKAQSGIGGVIGSLKTLGVTIGAGVVARGIKTFVEDIVEAGDVLGKTSSQLGVGVKELQGWQNAANFAGATTQEFNTGLRTFAKNALLAQQGSKQAAEAFDSLGVEIEDSGGNLKDNTALMREAGLALGKIENSTERVALAQQLFGRAGTKLLPLFGMTAEALDKLIARTDELGGGLSEKAVKLAEETADAFKDWDIATDSLKSTLAEELLPRIRDSTRSFAEWLGGMVKSGKALALFKGAVVALGLALANAVGFAGLGGLGGALLKLGKSVLLPLAKFVLLFLVVDDLIALFEGRGSIIGTFIDKIFGEGTAKALVQGIKDVGKAFSDLMGSGDFGQFDKDLENIFGPPGQALIEGVIEMFDSMALAIGEFIVTTATDIDTWLVDSMASIRGSITGFAKAAMDLAVAIVDGIVDGIMNSPGKILDALTSVVDAAIDAIKKKFKIDSPSKVTGKTIGGPLVEGIGVGALDAARSVSQMTAKAISIAASQPAGPSSISGSVRGGGGGGVAGGVVFKSNISLSVSGGSAGDESITKLRQGVRSELRDNRRATLDALNQMIEAPV